jgi:hypothetical protein
MVKFELYRMVDNKTPLSEIYFNFVFKDIDARIDTLENLKVSWEDAVRQITDFGLERINEVLGPSFDFLNQKKTDADDLVEQIEELRSNADSLINQSRDDAISAVEDKRVDTLNQIQQQYDSAESMIVQNRDFAISSINDAQSSAIEQIDEAKQDIDKMAKRFEHNQDEPSSLWVVDHNLNSNNTPIVKVYSVSYKLTYLDGYSGGGHHCGDSSYCGQDQGVNLEKLNALDYEDVIIKDNNSLFIEFLKPKSGRAVVLM